MGEFASKGIHPQGFVHRDSSKGFIHGDSSAVIHPQGFVHRESSAVICQDRNFVAQNLFRLGIMNKIWS